MCVSSCLNAQRTAGSVLRNVTGQFNLGPDIFPRPWRLQIAARTDGWVEFLLESVPTVAPRVPWLVSRNRRTLAEPIRTRAVITPDVAAKMAQTLDSLLSYRVRGAAQAITLLHLDSIPNSNSMFYVFAHEVFAPLPGLHDTTASIGFAGCVGWPEAGVAETGSGFADDTNIAELRRLSRSIRLASLLSTGRRSELRVPVEVSADEAGCAARPMGNNPVPSYPTGQWDRFGTQRVSLDAVIDTTGRIDPSSVVGVAGAAPFMQNAQEALLNWRFYPAMMAPRRPVRQRMHFEVLFDRKEPQTESEENLLLAAAGQRGADMLIIARPPST